MKKFVPAVRDACRSQVLLAGTIDSWLVWNLIRGLHVTDCTNASRTLLMNLNTLQWDPVLTRAFSIDESILPEIRSSSEIIGKINDGSELDGIVISAVSIPLNMCYQLFVLLKCVYVQNFVDYRKPASKSSRPVVFESRSS